MSLLGGRHGQRQFGLRRRCAGMADEQPGGGRCCRGGGKVGHPARPARRLAGGGRAGSIAWGEGAVHLPGITSAHDPALTRVAAGGESFPRPGLPVVRNLSGPSAKLASPRKRIVSFPATKPGRGSVRACHGIAACPGRNGGRIVVPRGGAERQRHRAAVVETPVRPAQMLPQFGPISPWSAHRCPCVNSTACCGFAARAIQPEVVFSFCFQVDHFFRPPLPALSELLPARRGQC